MSYPAEPPTDPHGRAVWHAQARAWWRAKAAEAKPRTRERRDRLAWASQHEAAVVRIADLMAQNVPIV